MQVRTGRFKEITGPLPGNESTGPVFWKYVDPQRIGSNWQN